MSSASKPPQGPKRSPAAFSLEVDSAASPKSDPPRRKPRSFDGGVIVTPDEQDPFSGLADLPEIPLAEPRRRRFSFLKLSISAFSILLSLAFGLWVDALVRDLYSRAPWLGYVALAVVAIALGALAIFIIREMMCIARLEAVQTLKADAVIAASEHRTPEARAIVAKLTSLIAHRPETARGRDVLKATEDDIIDAPHLLSLAERELLLPLDIRARGLILGAAKRVSVVTAVSPRAVVDLAYVLFEVVRLVRSMAELYGGRPGGLGQLRLLRDVLAHLAVTGSIAVGDSLAQQVLGHGLASRLSARLGEGVINGLMTARIGIAAMDLCRPLPFIALRRPGIGDFMGDLTSGLSGGNKDSNE
ncbi:TIGR01620 family protein [Rhizobium sp. RU36D]|uniref:YcjF family protein n=1 Tax=Rhizobium sp. RU36D TaxID=1907415 RepID=UPI0009D8CB05|nr:TIGR01620 family protein [Rhizobium sp. RU36D]SMC80902.1 putative membrane protein [Rhizobium sp. RU36D]